MTILNFNIFGEIISAEFLNSDEVTSCVRRILLPTDTISNAPPSVIVEKDLQTNQFRLRGEGLYEPFTCDDPVNAACGVTSGLIGQYAKAIDNRLCFHAAALIYKGKAFLIPSTYESGKSYFCLAWLESGEHVLTDDAALIDEHTFNVSSFGLPLCLRNNSFRHLANASQNFINERKVVSGKNLTYIRIDTESKFSNTQTYPLGGWLFLSRGDAVSPNISKIAPGNSLQKIIWQNFARKKRPSEIIDIGTRLASEYPSYFLFYSDARDIIPELKIKLEELEHESVFHDNIVELNFKTDQADNISVTLSENGALVADDHNGRVYSFNQTAMQFWYLITTQTEAADAIEILHSLYPDISRRSLHEDYAAFEEKLSNLGLIQNNISRYVSGTSHTS